MASDLSGLAVTALLSCHLVINYDFPFEMNQAKEESEEDDGLTCPVGIHSFYVEPSDMPWQWGDDSNKNDRRKINPNPEPHELGDAKSVEEWCKEARLKLEEHREGN